MHGMSEKKKRNYWNEPWAIVHLDMFGHKTVTLKLIKEETSQINLSKLLLWLIKPMDARVFCIAIEKSSKVSAQ